MKLSPLNKRRLQNFKSNKRGFYSFWIFSFLFIVSIFADFIANDKPLLIKFDQEVIRKECPNTPEEHRLMRPEMLEKLLEFLPTNIVEFGEKIPQYLRESMQKDDFGHLIDSKHPDCQNKFIKDVVNNIGKFGKR